MSKLIVGNLKSNMMMEEVGNYIYKLNASIETDNEVVICPSLVHIPFFINENYKIGAQDVSIYESGAYTGEVSAEQLKSCNVSYVIVGHDERRRFLKENDEIANKKVKQCLENGLAPIICIGETKEEKIMMQTESAIRRHLLDVLMDIDKEIMDNIVVAYEPIWSIGTGIVPTAGEIDEIALFIKDIVKSAYKIDIRVIYGGSIDSHNIDKFIKADNIDGFLMGSSSYNPIEFAKIINKI